MNRFDVMIISLEQAQRDYVAINGREKPNINRLLRLIKKRQADYLSRRKRWTCTREADAK